MLRRRGGALLAAGLLATFALVLVGPTPSARAASDSSTPSGYWLVASDGGVFSFGGMVFAGSTGGIRLNRPIVGMAGTPQARGYWLVASDGGIFSFGDAGYFGSTGAIRLNQPIVGMAATPTGNGYWLVASDGGIFAFGDARYFGSTGAIRLNQPIVGMAATPTGNGYWLVASDGGIFAFGDAAYSGSTGAIRLNQPIVGMAATPTGNGYWLAASDGGIFAFGDAGYFGSTGATKLNQPIVGMAATPTGNGYWLAASDGGIFAFGDAPFRGSTGAVRLARPVVGIATGPSTNPYVPGSTGYDISWPQCGGTFPARPFAFGIVGTTNGMPFTANPCFAAQWAWAGVSGSVYLVLSMPTGPEDAAAATGPAGTCAPTDELCRSYNFGWNAAQFSDSTVRNAGATPLVWWLDVETPKPWSANQAANARVVQGAIDSLASLGHTVGVYSTSYQWGVITGGYRAGRPIWVAGAPATDPASRCDPAYAFGGGKAWLTQYARDGYDGDFACAVN